MGPTDSPISQTHIDTRFSFEKFEQKWTAFWDEHQLWRADLASQKMPYSMVLPPPNITGILHIGHALTISIEDCIARYKRMMGFEVLWIPGLDHAGIATQTVVERDLWHESRLTRQEVGRENFLKRIWDWKEDHQRKILDQIKHLGASCDWSRLCFSLDDDRCRAVHQAFKLCFDRGLIYRGQYMVNWDPVLQTALADDEVEHEERQSTLYYIRYCLKEQEQGNYLIVATTRPETILGDVALAVHPDDHRYSHLVGQTAYVPLINRPIPILADRDIDRDFGSGVVKITPAHDSLDYRLGERHQLNAINIISEDGSILLPDDAKELKYGGLKTHLARQRICDDLMSAELIAKTEPHCHRVGISYRSKAIIEPRLSHQWFFKLSAYRKTLRDALEKENIDLIPESWRATYFHWVDGLRDWCISRQLWWGHQIPIWRHEVTGQIICPNFDDPYPQGDHWKRDEDVLDTWFSSALWPMSALGWPKESALFDRFFPNALLETGCDILFFWVARMAIMGKILTQKWPFKVCYLHGLIYAKTYWRQNKDLISYVSDAERREFDLGMRLPKGVKSRWEKMSKSKQNVLNPKEITEKYGVDAVRFALVTSPAKLGQIDLDRRKFDEFRNFTNKLWNAARFAIISIQLKPSLTAHQFSKGLDLDQLLLEDRWILARLRQVCARYHGHFDLLDLNAAAEEISSFFWDEFCAIYIEIVKPVMQLSDSSNRRTKQQILAIILTASLRLLHPIIPYITEELFKIVKTLLCHSSDNSKDLFTKDCSIALSSKCCMISPSPQFELPTDHDLGSIATFDTFWGVVRAVRNLRAELGISKNRSVNIFIITDDEMWNLIEQHTYLFEGLVGSTSLIRIDKEPNWASGFASFRGIQLHMQLPDTVIAKELERIERELPKIERELAQLDIFSKNRAFRERAPKELIQKKENQQFNLNQSLNTLVKMRDRLKSTYKSRVPISNPPSEAI